MNLQTRKKTHRKNHRGFLRGMISLAVLITGCTSGAVKEATVELAVSAVATNVEEPTRAVEMPVSETRAAEIVVVVRFEEERAAILAAGCDDLVHKPFQEEEIFKVMARHPGVRYVYEYLAQPAKPAAQVVLTAADLAALPTDWIADLRQAAMRGQSEQVLALLDQLPPDQTSLAEALAGLVHSFRFDKIVALTQEEKDNA